MIRKEETLDPQEWVPVRKLGHQMLDDIFAYLESVRQRPVWTPLPADLAQHFAKPLPQEGEGLKQAYADFVQHVLPHPLGNIHPRFWAWVCGTGTVGGMLAEMLLGGINSSVHGAAQAAVKVEEQLISWCKEMFGYPAESSGVLVSGGSMANLVGLTVARNTKAGVDVNDRGLQAAPPLTIYCSTETHNSMHKAIGLLGLGRQALRLIPVNAEYEIELPALKKAIAEDRVRGFRPICVVGNAGTVNTGAIDALNALADICQREDMWFHVDGAFGAIAALSPSLAPKLAGMERSDSLAFDFHKWMYMQYDAGCTLVRHRKAQHDAFTIPSSYLSHGTRGLASGDTWFSEYGIELSRQFRALKIWMSIKEHGVRKYARLVEQNVAQAQYLVSLVNSSRHLEVLAPAPLNIVCFRYKASGLNEPSLNELNKEILLQLQEQGIAAPSSTVLNEKFAIRVAISNHRSRFEDFDVLAREVVRLGNELVKGFSNDEGKALSVGKLEIA